MGKSKKPFIDKKTASVYHVVRRSQRDVGTEATSETLSDFVLMPSPENAVKELARAEKALVSGASSSSYAEEAAAEGEYGNGNANANAYDVSDKVGGKTSHSHDVDFNTLKSQITAAGLLDTTATTYSQYTKPINASSGKFINATSSGYLHTPDAENLSGLFTDTSKNSLDTALDEAMAVHEVGRMLDSIALTADCMEEDMARALFDEYEEEEFEEILDDFCFTANQEVLQDDDDGDGDGEGGNSDGGGFDYEQHIQMLMEKARLQETGGEAGRELDDDFFSGVAPLHGKIEEEEGEDEFDYDQYGEEVGEDEDSLDREFNGRDDTVSSNQQVSVEASKTMTEEQQRILTQKFEEALLEYDSDDVGDLNEECEEIVGDRPLEGDMRFEAVLDEFLTDNQDDILIEGDRALMRGIPKHVNKRTGGSGYSALVGTTMINASDLQKSTLAVNIAESKKQMERDLAEADATLANPEMDLPPEEVFIDGKSYFSLSSRNPYDCESILSTYSNLDNNPAVIGRKKKKKKVKKNSKTVGNGDDAIPEDGPMKIQLSAKTGLPIGTFDRNNNEPEEEYPHDDDDDYYYNESDTYLSVNRGEARPKQESKMEKKQRKMAIKDERKICRMQKKIMKEAFKEEFQKRGHDVVADAVGGNTVFRFS